MRRTLKSTLIFVLVAILAFVSGEEATLQQYKRLKDILLNFYGGMNGIYRHVQSGKDLSFFQRAEERLPGYLRDISAAWDAGITLYGHVAELGVEDAKFVEVTNEDTNQMYAKLARRIGLDVRRVRPVRLKKPPATKKHLALMDAELAALEDISIKFYQLGEDFIFGDMKEDELRYLDEHIELANAVSRLFKERFVEVNEGRPEKARQVHNASSATEFDEASTLTSQKKQTKL